MADFFDLLLGARAQDDGEELPARKSLNFIGFELEDDPANDRIIVRRASSGGDLDGDVFGDMDANRVAAISGDQGIVSVFATGFQWDSEASETEPVLKIGGDGAIELWNDGKRSIAASAGGPVLGHSTAVTRMIGGLRLTRRLVNAHTTLDTTTTDTLVIVDASGERNITLPAPTDGRTWVFMIKGSSPVTLRRPGAQLINGNASHYVVPFDDACVIATSDGVDYYARSFSDDVDGGGGGAPVAPAMTFSPVDFLTNMPMTGSVPGNAASDTTLGMQFAILAGDANVEITGIRFYWAGVANETVRCDLWCPTTSSTVAEATVDIVTSGPGYYTGTFASPYLVPTNRYNAVYIAAIHDVAGGHYTHVSGTATEVTAFMPARPFLGGSRIVFRYFNRFKLGAGMPDLDDGSEWCVIEPVIQEV